MSPLQLFCQQLINGLTLGSIYALIALGYTMIYGVLQLINFAHGEVFMVGAYAALGIVLWMGGSAASTGSAWWVTWIFCAAGAMATCGLLGLAMERLAYRPLRQAPRLNALITAIGLSLILQNALMILSGATDRPFPSLIPPLRWEWNGVMVTLMQVMVWTASGLLMILLRALVMGTRLGVAMRATAQDLKACAILGLPIDRIIAATFALGSLLAGIGGFLFGLNYGTINFHDGYSVGLKAFTAAVLGGIGNIPGAMVGGLLLGLLEGLGAGYLSAQWKNVFAFVILVVLLLFRPQGLLGERVAERA
ncbi:MAG: branched-chain amino acid ABC transporter permease [Candidatus Omnitrophica bacterium]|nr:branched-chain amino acid ABC transporter permease [Candidatus Omnitrophota bacterium]